VERNLVYIILNRSKDKEKEKRRAEKRRWPNCCNFCYYRTRKIENPLPPHPSPSFNKSAEL